MSLELKLPLLMSAVLAAVLATSIVVTSTTLRRTQLSAVGERLQRATRQLATLGAASLPVQQARFTAVANDSAIRRELAASPQRSPSREAVAALARLVTAADSGMPAELWTADGRRVAFVGNDVRATMRIAPGKPELPVQIAPLLGDTVRQRNDSLQLGPLYADNGRVHFWFVMPVRDRGRTLGYLSQQRVLALGSQTARTLRELSGDSVSLYYRNVDGGFWASGSGQVFPGLRDLDNEAGEARDSTNSALLVHEERIGATPLVVGMYVPERFVLARPARTIRTILMLSIALLLAGVLAAWLIGRSVANPLAQITRAAGSLAAGNYDARVPSTGDVEVRHLADAFNHMAEEIGASRAALQLQTQEAQAANSAKSEFLTTMSHELRTPLNAIGGYADLMEMELRGPVTDAQRRDLQRIRASQQHLLGLISSVLDLSRIEAGQVAYDLETVAVDSFLAGLDALVAPQAAAKQVQLVLRDSHDLAVVADREKLRQIILNLLSNAIRHTPAGGSVTLSAQLRGSRVAIVVDDTGPGIAAEKRDVIFEPFVQLDRSLTKTREGLGLGLAISRDLARGMAGDLTVESNAGGGARFVLTLQRGSAERASREPFTGEMAAQRRSS